MECPGGARLAAPTRTNRAVFGACSDVAEHELIRALIAVGIRALQVVPNDLMIAETDTLYDGAVAHVDMGDDSLSKNACYVLLEITRIIYSG
jgi:hypothetical protein